MPRCTFCDHNNPPGTHNCQNCGADFLSPSGPTSGPQDDLERQVRYLLAEGRKIEAIKLYREQTGMGLKGAKDAVEAIQRGVPTSQPEGVDEPFQSELVSLLGQGKKVQAIKLYRERTGAGLKEAKDAVEAVQRGQVSALTGLDDAIVRELVGLLQQGQNIEAIKLYRERTGAGLKDAKEAVEALAARRGLLTWWQKRIGCLGGIVLILVLGIGAFAQAQGEPPTISEAQRDGDGFLVHAVESEYQAGPTQIRVLLPDRLEPGVLHPVVYVLPVEPQDGRRYGDGLIEVRKHDLHNRHGAIFIAPTFTHLPWYADHPTNPRIRQETYFLEVVVPFIERHYPARTAPDGRLLLGFSKSGWGAYSLLLRHPEVFGRAAAWDAPLMMDSPGKYGSGDIFGSQANFETYRITKLLERRADDLRGEERLILLGYGNFRDHHRQAHALMERLGIPHTYRDGPEREHDWHSGWVPEAVELLMGVPSSD
jgi:ribosomal protein L7/L12